MKTNHEKENEDENDLDKGKKDNDGRLTEKDEGILKGLKGEKKRDNDLLI